MVVSPHVSRMYRSARPRPTFSDAARHGFDQEWAVIFKLLASWTLVLGSWIFLLAWAAVLLMPSAGSEPDEEALVAVGLPRNPSPRRSAVVLPLPESRDDDAYGNA